jgi:hypothetical protein
MWLQTLQDIPLGITDANALERSGRREAASQRLRRHVMSVRIIANGAGKRQQIITKSMNQTSNLSLANRKQLTDLLADKYEGLRYKAKQRYNQQAEILRRQFINEYAKKEEAGTLLKDITTLQAQLDSKQALLRVKGLEVRAGAFQLHSDAPDSVDELLDKQVEEKIGTRGDIDTRFDDAQVRMMTIGTLEEARKLIETLMNV